MEQTDGGEGCCYLVQGGSEGLAQGMEFPEGCERESHKMKGTASAKTLGWHSQGHGQLWGLGWGGDLGEEAVLTASQARQGPQLSLGVTGKAV